MSDKIVDISELMAPHPEDPVGPNPAPDDHPAHKIWADATAEALEDVFRLNARMMAKRPSPAGMLDWSVELAFFKYQIWAKRNLSIVRRPEDARAYELWLDNFLQECVTSFSTRHGVRAPIIKAKLSEACNYWKGNAWSQVRDFATSSEQTQKDAAEDCAGAGRSPNLCSESARDENAATAGNSMQAGEETMVAVGEPPLPIADADRESRGAPANEANMFEATIHPLKVRLRRKLISPEDALIELRAIANDDQQPVRARAAILEELDALSQPSTSARDYAANGLQAALAQSEEIRREAVTIILDRIMASPEVKDWRAASRFAAETGQRLAAPLTSETTPPAARPPAHRTPRETIDSTRVGETIRSYEKLASRIGISKDSLYAIKNETRWVSDHSYGLVAKFCKCEPEELHPSDLPRPNKDQSG